MEHIPLLIKVTEHLKQHYPDLDNTDLKGSAKWREAKLSVIRELAGYGYDKTHQFFTRDIGNTMFATEMVEMEAIDSIPSLCEAVGYLNEAYQKRLKTLELGKNTNLPDELYTQPDTLREISRDNVLGFLKESYRLDGEKELLGLSEGKQKEVIYAMYRAFTGYVPDKHIGAGIFFSVPESPEMALRYGDLPNFESGNDLFSHIRMMRRVHQNTQTELKETTAQRIEELKRFAEDQQRDRDDDQSLEH